MLFLAPTRSLRSFASTKPTATSLRCRMRKHKAALQVIPPREQKGAIAPHIREILGSLGEDPDREGLKLTPARVEKALKYLTSGYETNIDSIVNGAVFSVAYDEMVIV